MQLWYKRHSGVKFAPENDRASSQRSATWGPLEGRMLRIEVFARSSFEPSGREAIAILKLDERLTETAYVAALPVAGPDWCVRRPG